MRRILGALSITAVVVACGAADGETAGGGVGNTSGSGAASGSGGTWPGGSGGTGNAGGASAGGTGATGGTVGGTGGMTGGTGGTTGGTGGTGPVDCSGISNNSNYELCESGPNHCYGVFTDGSGCNAFCAAAGLKCVARFGGEPGCQKETGNALNCDDNNGHGSDWCECEGDYMGIGGSGMGGTGQTGCDPVPGNPPSGKEQSFTQATFAPRSSWVLDCRDYAYSAQFAEHEMCDSQYMAGSGKGTATFTFNNVAKGTYDVFVEGRHTTNRNPAGAVVRVTSNGQTHTAKIMQRDDGGLVSDLHGTYCLDGMVEVVMDSTVNKESDSVRRIILTPK